MNISNGRTCRSHCIGSSRLRQDDVDSTCHRCSAPRTCARLMQPWKLVKGESIWSHVLVGGRRMCRRRPAQHDVQHVSFVNTLAQELPVPLSHTLRHAQIRVSRKQTPGCRLRCAHTSFLQRSIHPRTSPCVEHARLGSTTSFAPIVQPLCLPQRAPERLPDRAEPR